VPALYLGGSDLHHTPSEKGFSQLAKDARTPDVLEYIEHRASPPDDCRFGDELRDDEEDDE